MKILAAFKTLISNKKSSQKGIDLSESQYAMTPFLLMTNNSLPFSVSQDTLSQLPSELVDFWQATISMYQLFSFHLANHSTRGKEFGDRIFSTQIKLMNENEFGWGDSYKSEMLALYNAVNKASNNPTFITGKNGERLEVPVEYLVALEVLTTSKDSPFCINADITQDKNYPDFPNDLDWKLAIDLENAKRTAVAHFVNLLNNLKLHNDQ